VVAQKHQIHAVNRHPVVEIPVSYIKLKVAGANSEVKLLMEAPK